jgi:hypothetical protein
MAIDQRVWKLIQQGARARGLDPRAVGAVALSEGGLRYGAVGDQGSSYGPFQLHRGGALPAGRGAAWANSPAGINYALDRMAFARGMKGRQAISHIVKRFERPADPTSEISRAWQHYQSLGGAAVDLVNNAVPGAPGSHGRPGRAAVPASRVFDPGKMGNRILKQFAQGGGNIDFSVLPGLVGSSYRTIPGRPGRPAVPGQPGTPGTPSDPGDLAKGHVPKGQIIPATFSRTHETSGLPGYPATDWFKPAGTLVGAPVSGKITRISGGAGSRGSGIYGWNVYITGDDGSQYFLTHFGSLAGLKEGMRIKRGTPMGRVAKYGNASHIHVGRKA